MAMNIKLARSTIPPQDGNDSCSIDYAPTAGQAKVSDVTVSRPTLEFGKFASIITPNFKGMNDQEYQFTMDAAVRTVGKVIGDWDAIHGVILSDDHDKYGHRYVMVQWFCNPKLATVDRNCPACHGEPTKHRYDKIQAGRVKSCGRLKKQRYREYVQRKTKHPAIDVTGKPIPATTRPKKGRKQ